MTNDIEEATARVDRDKSRYDSAIRYLVGLVAVSLLLGLGAGLWLGVQLRAQNEVMAEQSRVSAAQGVAIEQILKTQTESSKTRVATITEAIEKIDKNQRAIIAAHDRKIELLVRRVVATTKAEVQAPENQEGR